MNKLKLEELEIESFHTDEADADEDGTVHGQTCHTDPDTCERTCDGDTCYFTVYGCGCTGNSPCII